MYVIYINDRPLRLLESTENLNQDPLNDKSVHPTTHLVARYTGRKKTLLNYIDTLEKGSPRVRSIDIVYKDVEILWDHFKSHFKWVAAAGGIVNLEGTDNILFIFRRGYWDLPKGKIDEGEQPAEAAIREVKEETGLKNIVLEEKFKITYHTYRNKKNKRVLKPTYWYAMSTNQQELTPEMEEGIIEATWRKCSEILVDERPIYKNIYDMINEL